MIYASIFKALKKIGALDLIKRADYAKSESDSFMPLSLDVLRRDDDLTIIALAHSFEQNGDLMADPDMTIAIHHQSNMAQALSFQNDSLGLYQEIYDTFPTPKMVNPALKADLNKFLNKWLKNAISQGHSF